MIDFFKWIFGTPETLLLMTYVFGIIAIGMFALAMAEVLRGRRSRRGLRK